MRWLKWAVLNMHPTFTPATCSLLVHFCCLQVSSCDWVCAKMHCLLMCVPAGKPTSALPPFPRCCQWLRATCGTARRYCCVLACYSTISYREAQEGAAGVVVQGVVVAGVGQGAVAVVEVLVAGVGSGMDRGMRGRHALEALGGMVWGGTWGPRGLVN
jgi:hypothetical protein